MRKKDELVKPLEIAKNNITKIDVTVNVVNQPLQFSSRRECERLIFSNIYSCQKCKALKITIDTIVKKLFKHIADNHVEKYTERAATRCADCFLIG